MKRNLILCLAVLMQGVCLASTADSLRSMLAKQTGEQKTETFRKLFEELQDQGASAELIPCLNEWIAHEEQQGNKEEERQVRWNKVVVMTNYAMDSLLLAEAPEQMTWFMHNDAWEYYYDTWDSRVNVFLYTGRIQTALREAHNILDDANARQNNFGRAVAYQEMGIIYESIGQYDQAIGVFRQCLAQLKDSYRDSEVLTNTYDYLCQTLNECKRYKEQLAVANEWEDCIQERLKSGHKSRQSMLGTYIACRCNKASALLQMGRYEETEQELKLTEDMLEEHNSPLGRYRLLLVRAYLAMAKGQPRKALAFSDSLQHLNVDAGGDTQLLRGDILNQLGRHDEAAEIFRKLYMGKDSTFTREMRMQLDELNTMYKVDELEMQSQLQRSRFMIGIAALLIVGLLLFTLYRFRASLRLAEEHEKLEQSYKELKIANQKAEESSRMKTNFIQQISHEIRTPLNILSGFTQVLTMPGMELDEETKHDANRRITENTNRITGLVNKMLALSEANSRSMIVCEDDALAVLIAAQAVDATLIAQNDDVQFNMQIAPEAEDVVLHTNLQQATQALTMLLDNAQKFLYSKHTAERKEKGKVTLLVNSNTRNVQFIVEDTGIGIPKKEAAHIFEEFVQLDDYYEGTGIGLTIARSIARRLGGDVVLDTSYEGGSRFLLRLPLKTAEA